MLKHPKCNIKDEINLEISHCMKLLEDYVASSSHYQKSLKNFYKPKAVNDQNIYDGASAFPGDATIKNTITEEEGVKML